MKKWWNFAALFKAAESLRVNILFINSIGRNSFGGSEKWMVRAAKGLKESGHSVFLASKEGSEILRAARRVGVRTHAFNVYSDFSPINTIRIARFLKKEDIQILVCNLNKDVRVAGLAARLVKSTVVIARHGVTLAGKKWKHKVTLTHLVDGILTNTQTIKQTYMSYGWFVNDFVEVIHNGVDDKSHVKAFDFDQLFQNKKVVFSAGRLAEQKGFDILMRAAAMLSKKRKDLVFAVAGKGGHERKLRRLARELQILDTFYFLGFFADIDPYLKGCDLFVLPSLFEGMPNVVMEAMALGKAVVATDVNGVRELVVDGRTGVIVPPSSAENLAEAIAELIDDERLLTEYGQSGRQRVREHFTISSMIEDLERYFVEKLDGEKGRA